MRGGAPGLVELALPILRRLLSLEDRFALPKFDVGPWG